jgi:hypothetical protein
MNKDKNNSGETNLEVSESEGGNSTGMVEVYMEFSKSAINTAGKLGKRSLKSVLGQQPFFSGNRADVHHKGKSIERIH